MELKAKYSYEYNSILNPNFNEKEQLRNFASLIMDKDRFLVLINDITINKEIIEKTLGFKLPKLIEFYIVRAEKFKSFSEPITIEYDLVPERMIILLMKEIVKTYTPIRFPDNEIRNEFIMHYLKFILKKIDEKKYLKFINEFINSEKSNNKEIKKYLRNTCYEKITFKESIKKYYEINN